MDRTVHMPWEVTASGKSYTLPAGYRVKVRDSQPWHETVILEFLWRPGTDFDDTIWAPVLATDVDRYTVVSRIYCSTASPGKPKTSVGLRSLRMR